MLQEIRLLFPEGTTLSGDVADALASVVTSSKQLQNVEISHCRCIYDPGVWRTITTAFRSNLAIKRLRLYNVVFSSDATTAFLDGMQTDQHSIRQLRLSKCQFRMYPQTTGLDFANMVCGAMLEHVELDHGVMSPGQVASFFATLSTNASTVRLRSMVVELLFDSTMLHPVEYVAPFVASTIHLESLTICICTNRSSDDDLLLSVPITALLTSMKSNASLREIKVFRKQDRQPAIRADAWRRIDAFTKRNRMLQVGLANVPQDLLHNTARRRMRPVLCRVALQASNRPDHETVAVLLALSTIM
jgi:hypothetical protein